MFQSLHWFPCFVSWLMRYREGWGRWAASLINIWSLQYTQSRERGSVECKLLSLPRFFCHVNLLTLLSRSLSLLLLLSLYSSTAFDLNLFDASSSPSSSTPTEECCVDLRLEERLRVECRQENARLLAERQAFETEAEARWKRHFRLVHYGTESGRFES